MHHLTPPPLIITLCHHPVSVLSRLHRHVSFRKINRFSNTESFPKRLWYFFFKNMHVVKYVVYIVYHIGTFKIISLGLILKGQSSFGEVDRVMIINLRSLVRLLQWSRIKGEACCVCECCMIHLKRFCGASAGQITWRNLERRKRGLKLLVSISILRYHK